MNALRTPRPRRQSRRIARGIAVVLAAALTAGSAPAAASAYAPAPAGQVTASQAAGARYQATIVRTAYGVPHITARNFGSLGFGYGFALASDNLCTMAQTYVTVEGQRSRYFGPYHMAPAPAGGQYSNLDSDIFWRSVIDRRVIPRLLAVRTGAGAVTPQVRQLMAGYAHGYNDYLASVGGSRGVPDPTCRGKAWVKPITTLDAYLLSYQLGDIQGLSSIPWALASAQPPPPAKTATASPATAPAQSASVLSALASSVVRTAPGTGGLPTTAQL
ncbi:MAG: penicillin acylase family protein, partial [Streptosporangiaceae bacterium]